MLPTCGDEMRRSKSLSRKGSGMAIEFSTQYAQVFFDMVVGEVTRTGASLANASFETPGSSMVELEWTFEGPGRIETGYS
jgi:hypothetical protein